VGVAKPDDDTRHFIYPLSLTGGYVFDSDRDINPANLVPDALRGAMDTWGLATNFRVIQPGDWVWAYFGGKVRRIHAVGVVAAPVGYNNDWGRHTVSIRWNAALTQELQDRPLRYDDYRQQVQGAVGRANTATTAVLNRWLRKAAAPAPQNAVPRVPREVLQRVGQSIFRAEAVRLFGGRCAVTGTSHPAVLQAAHINPISAGGTHEGANTLLLRSDLHNLFDLGLLTVTRGLRVEISEDVTDRDYRALDGIRIQVPAGVERKAFVAALDKHRARWIS
jgi:hypothetical protein